MLIDTHCHLTYEIDNDAGVDGVIERAKSAGVGVIICPTADPEDIPTAIKIAETYDNVFATIGIHPEHADCNADDFITSHTRDAENDTAEILNKYSDIGGVMHCFTSGWYLAKKMLDRGFFFSASGILTFKNAAEIRETFSKIPIERIVIETDSPYCAPVPYRGKVCEPAFVVETARVMAEIKNIPFEKLSDIMLENVKKLYPKIKI